VKPRSPPYKARGRAATLEDVANAAAFAASDWARSMTAAIINVSCGALID
jgi:3-oxoacyl-[acyl-carrier protein] reductase